MKMQGLLFLKTYEEFQVGDSRALHQTQGPFEHKILCDSAGSPSMKPALSNLKVEAFSLVSVVSHNLKVSKFQTARLSNNDFIQSSQMKAIAPWRTCLYPHPSM